MAIAEFAVIPIVEESKVNKVVEKAIEVVQKSGLKFEVGANGTTIEGDLGELLDVIKEAHIVARDYGSGRVYTVIKIDDRKDGVTISEKIKKFR